MKILMIPVMMRYLWIGILLQFMIFILIIFILIMIPQAMIVMVMIFSLKGGG